MPTFTQDNRQLRLATPLGKDALLIVGLTGREGISELFNYQIDAVAQPGGDADYGALLGQPVSIEMDLPNGKLRQLHGVCNRITEGGQGGSLGAYQLHVVPQLWFLSQRSQSRVFQHLTVPQILKQVLTGVD